MAETKRALQIMENIAVVAQHSSEIGDLDPTIYTSVFEYIADMLHALNSKLEGGAVA